MIWVFIGVPESYGNSPGSIWALLGFRGKREGRMRASQGLVRIGLGGGAAPPPSFSSLFPFLLSYSYYMEGGILLPVGIGLPRARHSRGPALPLLHSFIYGGGGHPIDTQVDLLAMCGAPSTVTHLDHTIVVLRRSPTPVASSSLSPRCRADGTHPRPQLD